MADREYPATTEEYYLLRLLCGRADTTPPAGLSPELLWNLAEVQGVTATVARQIQKQSTTEWASSLLTRANNCLRFTLVRNVQLLDILRHIREAFQEEGHAWISMKGPVFTEQYYGDHALRPSGDLDVLVRPADVGAADRALRRIGIVPRSPVIAERRIFGVLPHEHRYYSETPRYLVELHWSLADGCYSIVDTDAAFNRRMICGTSTDAWPVLSAEDTLLYACMHGFGHRWEHLSHILNVYRILEQTHHTLDWEYVVKTARQHGKERALLLALSLARHLFTAPIPETVRLLIEQNRMLLRLRQDVLCNMTIRGPVHSRQHVLVFKLRGLETRQDRLKLLLRTLMVLTHE